MFAALDLLRRGGSLATTLAGRLLIRGSSPGSQAQESPRRTNQTDRRIATRNALPPTIEDLRNNTVYTLLQLHQRNDLDSNVVLRGLAGIGKLEKVHNLSSDIFIDPTNGHSLTLTLNGEIIECSPRVQ